MFDRHQQQFFSELPSAHPDDHTILLIRLGSNHLLSCRHLTASTYVASRYANIAGSIG